MKKIKSYEDFHNEEINLKKALAGAALGAGLAFGSPAKGQDVNSQEFNKRYTQPQSKINRQTISPTVLSKSEVKKISKYDTMASIKVPKDFDIKDAKIYASFLWNSQIPSCPFGTMIIIHSPKISFYVNVKSNWQFDDYGWTDYSSDTYHEDLVNTPIIGDGSYRTTISSTEVKTHEVHHRKIFNLGIAKTIPVNKKFILKGYLGCGLSRERINHWTETTIGNAWSEYLATIDVEIDQPPSFSTSGELTRIEYINKLNINGGLLFDFGLYKDLGGLSMGIGFDTNPAGINLMLGFTFGKKNQKSGLLGAAAILGGAALGTAISYPLIKPPGVGTKYYLGGM